MTIGLYERFTAHDWCKYAGVGGKGATFGCWILGMFSLFFGFKAGIAIWTILVGFLLAIWEFPSVYFAVSRFDQIQELFTENFKLKLPAIRAILYVCLSIVCFTALTPCIIAGLGLLASALLYLFAQINQNEEAKEGTSKMLSTEKKLATDRTILLSGGNTFGTFI